MQNQLQFAHWLNTVSAVLCCCVLWCRLWQTREVLHQCLINAQLNVRQLLEDTDSYLNLQVGLERV